MESGLQNLRGKSVSVPNEQESAQMRNFGEYLDYYNLCYFRFNRDCQELADQSTVSCVLPKKKAKYERWQITVGRVAAQRVIRDKGITETTNLQFHEFDNNTKTRQLAVIEFINKNQ